MFSSKLMCQNPEKWVNMTAQWFITYIFTDQSVLTHVYCQKYQQCIITRTWSIITRCPDMMNHVFLYILWTPRCISVCQKGNTWNQDELWGKRKSTRQSRCVLGNVLLGNFDSCHLRSLYHNKIVLYKLIYQYIIPSLV